MWTDVPEFAFYANYFNASQSRYRVDVLFRETPATALAAAAGSGLPDIVAARRLEGAAARAFLIPLDRYLEDGAGDAFYRRLLEAGRFDGEQILLPVSFNAPFAVFARAHSGRFADPLTVGLEELEEQGRLFNVAAAGRFTRMGFSPGWNDRFLLTAASLLGTGFAEDGAALAWDNDALQRTAGLLHRWNAATNLSAADDFAFRFFTVPPESMVLSGLVLAVQTDSAAFFTMDESRRGGLDFRWLASGDKIPLDDAVVSIGLTGRGRRQNPAPAADAFVRWFFSAETQRGLLESSQKFRRAETSFGIAGGFSALRPVTEQVFPLFHPDLLGRLPPEDFLTPAPPLPADWTALADRVVIPYLRERSRSPGDAAPPLETRVADWARLNRF